MGKRVVLMGMAGVVCVAGLGGMVFGEESAAVAAKKPVLTLTDAKGGVSRVAYSPDGKLLAAVSGDGTARVWDAGKGKLLQTMKGHEGVVISLAWSADGKQLATGGLDKSINVWNVTTGQIVDRHEQQCPVHGLAIMPDGKHLVSICGEKVRWWQEGQDEELFDRPQGDWPLTALALTPEGELVISDYDGHLAVLDGKTGAKLAENQVRAELPATSKDPGGKNWVYSIAPLGKSEAFLTDRVTVWDWNWREGTRKRVKATGGYGVAVTPDREMAVVGGWEELQVIDVKTQRVVVQPEMKNTWVTGVSIAPAGDRLAVSSGGHWENAVWTAAGSSVVWVYDLKAAEGVMADQRKAAAEKAAGGK
ncbi:MAG TPA: hypothetical protein VH253_13665 [Phycisphaerae bacterium]|nr:hypothetical protein [Phycisphaerae bacterium]